MPKQKVACVGACSGERTEFINRPVLEQNFEEVLKQKRITYF